MSVETVAVSIEKDEEGYMGRECPVETCLGYFKITPGTGLTGTGLPCHCPYCGHTQGHDHFHTREQIEYAKSVVFRNISDRLSSELKKLEFNHRPRGAFGIGISLKVEPGQRPRIHSYRERQLETEIVCTGCTLRYAVYGVFGFCPDCQQHNSLQILETNLAIVGKMLDIAETAERDLATKLIENALEDCVSAFDGFGREVCRLHGLRKADPRVDRWTFQNLETVRSNLRDHFNIDIATLVSECEWKEGVIGFQKRHLVSHRMGVVDQSYIEKAGDTRYPAGRKIEITASEVRTLSQTIKVLGEIIAKAMLSQSP
jgi:hypothetical protein